MPPLPKPPAAKLRTGFTESVRSKTGKASGRLCLRERGARPTEGFWWKLTLSGVGVLAFVIVFAGALLLLPLLAVRDLWREVPSKAPAGVYFAALGLGFMFLEICLIQKLTLFLGYPTYSLTVTLFALLVSSGAGSLLSDRYGVAPRAIRRHLVVLGAIVVGGHSPGQTSLVVRGVDRPVLLASDAVHYYEEYERELPFEIYVDLDEMVAGYGLLRELAAQTGAVLVPGHDPEVTERFPSDDGVVLRLE